MGTYFSTPCGEKSHQEGVCFTCFMSEEDECKEPFVKWKTCVRQAKKKKQDVVNVCYQETCDLRKCLEANPERYGELLKSEKSYGMRLLGHLKCTRKFKEGDIGKLEEMVPAFELIFHLQAHREARRRKKSWWFWP